MVFCTAQPTKKWTRRTEVTGEGVGGLEEGLLVPSSGKTADYGSWKIGIASVIASAEYSEWSG